MKKLIPYIVILVLGFMLYNKLVEKPEVITTTKVEWKTKTDTIHSIRVDTVPVVKYVQKVVTLKGKDSIVYVTKNDSTAIQANEYNTELLSNNAKATLKILTTGELLDVSGIINYEQKETTTEIVKTYNKSGLFLYGQTTLQTTSPEFAVGLDYVIKNKYIIGASYSTDAITKSLNLNVKIGIKIF